MNGPIIGLKAILLFGLFCITSTHGVYRSYEKHFPASRSAMAGSAGAAMGGYAQTISINPAISGTLPKASASLGVYGRSNILGGAKTPQVSFIQLPLLSLSSPISKNIRLGMVHYTAFERAIPELDFSQNNIEFFVTYILQNNMALSIGAGPAIGFQVPESTGVGYIASFSMFYRARFSNIGVVLRSGPKIAYKNFLSFGLVKEKLPPTIKVGMNKKIGNLEFGIDVEYIFWQYSFFEENGNLRSPKFSDSFLNNAGLHGGFTSPLPRVPGLRYGAGIYNSGIADNKGNFDREWFVTTGAYLSAKTEENHNRFQIGFALVTPLPSIFFGNPESPSFKRQNERIYFTFEFGYS